MHLNSCLVAAILAFTAALASPLDDDAGLSPIQYSHQYVRDAEPEPKYLLAKKPTPSRRPARPAQVTGLPEPAAVVDVEVREADVESDDVLDPRSPKKSIGPGGGGKPKSTRKAPPNTKNPVGPKTPHAAVERSAMPEPTPMNDIEVREAMLAIENGNGPASAPHGPTRSSKPKSNKSVPKSKKKSTKPGLAVRTAMPEPTPIESNDDLEAREASPENDVVLAKSTIKGKSPSTKKPKKKTFVTIAHAKRTAMPEPVPT